MAVSSGQKAYKSAGLCPCVPGVLRTMSKLAFKNYFSILEKCIIYLRKRKWMEKKLSADEA